MENICSKIFVGLILSLVGYLITLIIGLLVKIIFGLAMSFVSIGLLMIALAVIFFIGSVIEEAVK